MVAVVVTLAPGNVRGEGGGDCPRLGAVALDYVRHVVTDHPTEPSQLVPLVRQVVADVGRSGDAYLERRRVTTGGGSYGAGHSDGPADDERVTDLEDYPVGQLPASSRAQARRPPSKHPGGCPAPTGW